LLQSSTCSGGIIPDPEVCEYPLIDDILKAINAMIEINVFFIMLDFRQVIIAKRFSFQNKLRYNFPDLSGSVSPV
jgi:hypothetical protein